MRFIKEFYESLFDSKKAEALCRMGAAEIRQFVRFVEEFGENQVFSSMVESLMENSEMSRKEASSIAAQDYDAIIRMCQEQYDMRGAREDAKAEKKSRRKIWLCGSQRSPSDN